MHSRLDEGPAPLAGSGAFSGQTAADGNSPREARADAILITAVAGGVFLVYWLTLSRGVLGGDAGELQFVPPILGLTHPTGYPFQVLLHFAWSGLPFGSVAYGLNLLDAMLAAAAVGCVVAVSRALGVGRAGAALAGLSLAFGDLWWSQAVRGDKYTLNGLFLAVVLLLFLRWRAAPTDARFAALAFAYGLSLTHHRSMLLAAPALAVAVLLARWRPGSVGRGVLLPLLLAAAPLLLYAYVPWAGARGLPPGSWPVGTPAEFAEFLLDRGYTSQLRPDAAFGGRLAEEARVLLRSFGPLGVVVGLAGLVWTLRRRWQTGLVLLLVFLPQAILGASYQLESNYLFPRHWVFFLPAFLVWAVWVGVGFDAAVRLVGQWAGVTGQTLSPQRPLPHTPLTPRPPLPLAGEGEPADTLIGESGGSGRAAEQRPWWRAVVLPVAALALVLVVQAGTAWVRGAVVLVRAEAGAETMDAWRQDFQRSPVAERFGRLAFEAALPDAVIVGDWEQATVLWYLQRIEGRRPDIRIVYPIERLDETLRAARATGQPLYITRTLPGVESRGVTSSVGPLLQVRDAGASPAAAGRPEQSRPPTPVALDEYTRRFGQPAVASFDGGLGLVGVSVHTPLVQPGSVVAFTMVWQAEQALTEDYAASVRLLGPDGAILAQHDERHPALGTSPTSRWPTGALVGDYRELPVGSRVRPGAYQVQIVPYRVEPRQPLTVARIPPVPGQTVQASGEGIMIPLIVEARTGSRPLDWLAALLAR